MLEPARERVAAAGRRLAAAGLVVGTAGNISKRDDESVAITHGPDLAAAVEHSVVLEWACGIYWHAAAIGAPRTLAPDQREAVVEAVVTRSYGTTRAARPATRPAPASPGS